MLDQPSMIHKNFLNKARPSTDSLTIVIKIGTSSICDEKTHFPLLSNLSMIVETILQLKARGHRVVLVTSAAVGTGLRRLNIDIKPKKLAAIQVMILRYRLASQLGNYPHRSCLSPFMIPIVCCFKRLLLLLDRVV
jgi:hypothetical protein